MQSKRLHDDAGQKTFLVVLETGDEVMDRLQAFAEAQSLTAAQITAIGAFQEADLAFFDWETKSYESILVREQAEVATLAGDIARDEQGGPALHLHAVLGKRGGEAVAGHVTRGIVRPTLEIVITESPAHLRRVKDAASGLALIDPEAG